MEDLVPSFKEFFSSDAMRDYLQECVAEYPEKKSVEIDYSDLQKDKTAIADLLLKNPDAVVRAAESAVEAVAQTLPNPPEKKFTPHVRFYNLPSVRGVEVEVQQLGSEQLNKLARVEGVVNWITEIKPLMKTALWECIHCGSTIKTASEKSVMKQPGLCSCGRKDSFKLVEKSSEFNNLQRGELQDPIEKLRGSTPASDVELWLEDDLVNKITPGERIIATGILRLRPQRDKNGKPSSVYEKFLDVLHVQKSEREFEELTVTKEEEEKIIALSKNPKLFELITQSIAPSIYGYDELKQAIALQLFGGTPGKVQPDGEKIRSDLHVLLVGDPGCLIADERVALGNGAIAKISDLGEKHLQKINQPLLVGQGYKRAVATVFHKYERQPIIEVVTESGKCIKGTYNHPLLVIKGRERFWKRLDEIKEGDRLAVVPWIPCSITALQPTGWTYAKRTFGPKNKAVLPQRLSSKLAGLLGYLVGDGWVSRTRFAFDVNPEEKDLLPQLTKIIESEFKLEPHVFERKTLGKKPIFVIQVESVTVAGNLSFLKEKRAPDVVMRSGNKVVSEFLAWLFEADGCVFSKGRGRRAVQLKSASVELLRDVQILLLRFGIHSRIVDRNLTVRRAKAIRKFAEFVGFRSIKKKAKLKKLVSDVKNLHHEFGRQLSERVVLARPAGVADVFDVEVPSAKRFIANGIISHNTAKSSILEYVNLIAPKSVLVSGGSSSGVGLTAAAERDKEGEGWILKAGALVLANGGIAIIDEFDKMGEEDRGAMHQGMEQQIISIAKAGIVTKFPSRTSVLAAANPKLGRFDPTQPPSQQFDVSPALMSRFDLIFAIRDVLDETRDRKMADHILLGHKVASNKKKAEELPQDSPIKPRIEKEFLQKYIAYSRKTVFPILTDVAGDKIKEFYVDLRRLGAKQNTFPITARQIEGIIRLAEASAKARLSQRVEEEDAERAIKLVRHVLEEVFVDKETGKLDSDVIYVGQPKSKIDEKRNKTRILTEIVSSLEKKFDAVPIDDVVKEAASMGIDEHSAHQLLETLTRDGEFYTPRNGFIKSARKREWG